MKIINVQGLFPLTVNLVCGKYNSPIQGDAHNNRFLQCLFFLSSLFSEKYSGIISLFSSSGLVNIAQQPSAPRPLYIYVVTPPAL